MGRLSVAEARLRLEPQIAAVVGTRAEHRLTCREDRRARRVDAAVASSDPHERVGGHSARRGAVDFPPLLTRAEGFFRLREALRRARDPTLRDIDSLLLATR